jgi:NlpC/P60 family
MDRSPVWFHLRATNKHALILRIVVLRIVGCCAAASLVSAQATFPQESVPSIRLLTAKQGREIINAALEHDQPARGTRDCSHLVHEIYTRAGFAYPYASSFDLYNGSPNFIRIKTPQPGDLIVWPGHVGIVFDPKEHVFYSLVKTGLDAENYQAPYWRSRGRPRFFRYVVRRPEILSAAEFAPSARSSDVVEPSNRARVIDERTHADALPADTTAKEASERTPVFGPVDPQAQGRAASAPRSIVISAGKKQPTREEVAEGISELSNAASDALRTGDSLKAGAQVIVFGQLHVDSIEIKRDHGWALVQVESQAAISVDQVDLAKHSEQVHWELRRGKSGWEAVTPAARTYVPREIAVRGLAARLAELTQSDHAGSNSDGVRQEETQLAKVLNALLEEN